MLHVKLPTALALSLALAGTLALSACDDDNAPEPQQEEASTPTDGDTAGTPTADCPATSVAATTPGGATLTLEHAAAVSLEGGAAYTVYLSDFAIDAASLSMFSTPSVPETGTLFTVSVTIFNAQGELPVLEAGQVVEADRPFGELTFIVTTNEGATFDGNSAGQQGTVTLTAVGDPVCGTVEYSDNVRSLSGSFLAPTRSF